VIHVALKLAENIQKVSSEHFVAWSLKKKVDKEKWSKPPSGFCNVNFDTAIQEKFLLRLLYAGTQMV
jgi:hypothetical protein